MATVFMLNMNEKDIQMATKDMSLLIAAMDEQQVEKLLALFRDEELEVTLAPRTGLLMQTVKDCFETGFHLGEVLVTEASVVFRGVEGYAMVLGESPRRALARATSDAVLRFEQPTAIRSQLLELLEQEEELQNRKLSENAALVAATKVSFDLMPGA
jgi:alpha-D-ribose 1-methylphosphonate 5-triphosphate synthase subunit PhnG